MNRLGVVSRCALLVAFFQASAHATIVSVDSKVTLITPPASVVRGQLESNSVIFAFDERQNVLLSAPLSVNAVPPTMGKLTIDGGAIPNPVQILAGMIVNSHLLHFDVVGTPEALEAIVTGVPSVTFGEEILGVILEASLLDASDFLGAADTSYPTGTSTIRDFERLDSLDLPSGAPPKTLGEIAVFSHGTFRPDFPANGVDQLRVITQGVITQRVIPEPGTLFLLGSGLAVVGGSFRRRHRRSQGTC